MKNLIFLINFLLMQSIIKQDTYFAHNSNSILDFQYQAFH